MRHLILKRLMLAAFLATAVSNPPAMAQDSAVIRYAEVPAGAYAVVAQVRAKPGREAELREITLPLVALVRGDPKNLVYFLQENREAPGHFIFYEIFANKEDFDGAHKTSCLMSWPGSKDCPNSLMGASR